MKPSVAALNANKSKAQTPKRDSPATIAAKGRIQINQMIMGQLVNLVGQELHLLIF